MSGRTAEVERKTKETNVRVSVNLDGSGTYEVKCDIQFLRHMIETLSRYSAIDIKLNASGDDDHHIIEDVGITIGTAMKNANVSAIKRMSTQTVVMDDAMVMVSIDLADRPYAEIECPDPLYLHFLRSMAMAMGMTIHAVVMRGFDDHHIVEATFKALGLCLKDSLTKRENEVSTKGNVKVK